MTKGSSRCLTIPLGLAGAVGVWVVAAGLMTWGITGGPEQARWVGVFMLAIATVWTTACLLDDHRAKLVEAVGLQLMMVDDARRTTRLTPSGRE